MEQPTFADVEYESKKREDPSGGISGTDGWSDSLAASGGAYPPVLP